MFPSIQERPKTAQAARNALRGQGGRGAAAANDDVL